MPVVCQLNSLGCIRDPALAGVCLVAARYSDSTTGCPYRRGHRYYSSSASCRCSRMDAFEYVDPTRVQQINRWRNGLYFEV